MGMRDAKRGYGSEQRTELDDGLADSRGSERVSFYVIQFIGGRWK